MPSPNFARLLVAGALEYLAGLGIVDWDNNDDGSAPYSSANEWPSYVGPDMPSTPSRLVVATASTATFLRADVSLEIQIRLRGSEGARYDEVGDQAQAIHDAFYPNGFPLAHAQFGAVRVGAVYPGSTLPLSPDASRRHGHIQNFRIRARRPRPE